MRKVKVVALLLVLAMSLGVIRTSTWWHHQTAKGHHLFIAPITAWGFYNSQGETLVAYPPGQPDRNTIFDTHQYGPISDESSYPACAKVRPFCTPQSTVPSIPSKELDRAILPSPSFHVRFKP